MQELRQTSVSSIQSFRVCISSVDRVLTCLRITGMDASRQFTMYIHPHCAPHLPCIIAYSSAERVIVLSHHSRACVMKYSTFPLTCAGVRPAACRYSHVLRRWQGICSSDERVIVGTLVGANSYVRAFTARKAPSLATALPPR